MENQNRKIENFKMPIEIILYLAELVKEKCSEAEKKMIEEVVDLLKDYPSEPFLTSSYMKNYINFKKHLDQ